jgi:acetylornithine deacetylase/succinyl-diaminopimelate desuccinylase-like protein
MSPYDYAQSNASRFKDQLVELLRIPSVSTLNEHAPDVQRAAEWLIDDMRRIGMDARIYQKAGYLPLVYGEWLGAGDNAPTVLVYCHYDVQPAVMEDGWTTDPFEPVERDGKIYARGAVDSKSHVIAQLKAVESMLATDGSAPVNIKLLFEGEEESGSEHIFEFVAENKDMLACDAIVVSDGSNPAVNQPALVYGLRGVVTLELWVTGPARDLHSGHYGGNVHNPIQAAMEILSQLHDDNGAVTVPGFYDNVRELDDEERNILSDILPYAETEWNAVTGAKRPWGEKEYRLHERTGARPTLEFNGIAGGFYGDGFKTVLPSRVRVKISCRIVPDQDPERIAKLVQDHIADLTPATVTTDLRILEMGAPGILFDRNTDAMQAVIEAYKKGWGVKPIFSREGGSVPVVSAFDEHLDAQMVLMPFGYKGCGAHGPNEHVYLEMFNKGIATAIHFYDEFARMRD